MVCKLTITCVGIIDDKLGGPNGPLQPGLLGLDL